MTFSVLGYGIYADYKCQKGEPAQLPRWIPLPWDKNEEFQPDSSTAANESAATKPE
ncbi:MAG: hypothetical protein MHM6MM_000712 [Cercozoa sp. M6MM]